MDRCVVSSDTRSIRSHRYVFALLIFSNDLAYWNDKDLTVLVSHLGGRLGAVFGHKLVFSAGCAWWVLWALCGGFATNLVSMCFMRGLCGIGGGLMVPNIVALLGITFSPGKKRNLGLALFGAMAPVGAAGGSLVSAIIVQLSEWKGLFFLL